MDKERDLLIQQYMVNNHMLTEVYFELRDGRLFHGEMLALMLERIREALDKSKALGEQLELLPKVSS